MDAATSFPYTPVIEPEDADVKVPAWLNDPTLYHNRGNSTYTGESTTYGDFSGLDDLMTENPAVVNGFVDVYNDWVDLGVDGFRIDTAKHVNFEFWEKFTTAVRDHATAVGNPDFFMFGEVYDADPAKLSPYLRDSDMNAVLDFTFQSAAANYAKGFSARRPAGAVRGRRHVHDARRRTRRRCPRSWATTTWAASGTSSRTRTTRSSAPSWRTRSCTSRAASRSSTTATSRASRASAPAADKDARQSLFATQVAEYANQPLLDGTTAGSVDRYDTDSALYDHIAELAALRSAHPALQRRRADRAVRRRRGLRVLAASTRDEKVEHLVATEQRDRAGDRHHRHPDARRDVRAAVRDVDERDGRRRRHGLGDGPRPERGRAARPARPSARPGRPPAPITLTVPTAGRRADRARPPVARRRGRRRLEPDVLRVPGARRRRVDAARHVGDDDARGCSTRHRTCPTARVVEYRAVTVDAAGHSVRRLHLRERRRRHRRRGPRHRARSARLGVRARQPQQRDGLRRATGSRPARRPS